jgi:hypothetical protein
MRADYLRPWMDLLRARLEPGERILASLRRRGPDAVVPVTRQQQA